MESVMSETYKGQEIHDYSEYTDDDWQFDSITDGLEEEVWKNNSDEQIVYAKNHTGNLYKCTKDYDIQYDFCTTDIEQVMDYKGDGNE